MNRSLLIQFSILFLIIIILFFSYNYLLDANRDKKVADAGQESGNKEINLSKNSDLEVIEELSYISSDEKGNTYKILSDSGKINEEDPDILLLKNVFAEITLKNSGKIIGPLLGGLLVHFYSYKWMFWSISMLLAIWSLVLLKNSLNGRKYLCLEYE